MLMVVDQAPYLKKALARCRRLERELHNKQETLRCFEEEDVVEYQTWIHATFGAELSKIREKQQETLPQLHFVVGMLRQCYLYHRDYLEAVYKELLERLEKGTLGEYKPPYADEEDEGDDEDDDWEDDDWEDDDDDDDEDDDDEDDDDLWEALEEEDPEIRNKFDEFFRELGIGPPVKSSRQEISISVKTLYRALVKKLHPDHSTMQESLRQRRWDELQAAYRAMDLEALQQIEAVCDIESIGLSIEIGLARLNDLGDYHQSHVTPLRAALRAAKKNPAFGFAARGGQTKELFRNKRAELKGHLYDLESDEAFMRSLIADFAPKPPPKPRPKKKITPVVQKQPYQDPRQMELF
jgi:hypothetical protein